MKIFDLRKWLSGFLLLSVFFAGCKPVCQSIREDMIPNIQSIKALVARDSIEHPLNGEQCLRLYQSATKIAELANPVYQYILSPLTSTQTWDIDGRPGPGECIDERPITGPCTPNMNPWRGDIGRWSCSSEGTRCHRWILPQHSNEAHAVMALNADMVNLRGHIYTFCSSYNDAIAHQSAKDVLQAVLDRMLQIIRQHSQRVCR